MNVFFVSFLIAISLSMDAFSLSLIYGTYGIRKMDEIILSVIVGCFHFVMPILGLLLGNVLMNYFIFNLNLVVGIIFLVIGIEMIVSSNKGDDTKLLVSLFGFFLFGLSVSIDSFTTGIGLSVISSNYLVSVFIFMVVSGFFTYVGLELGGRINSRLGNYSTIIGGILMCLLAIHQLLKW